MKFNNLEVAIKDTIELAEIAIEEDDSSALDEISKAVSYTHLRAHETPLHLVCRLLLPESNGDFLTNL